MKTKLRGVLCFAFALTVVASFSSSGVAQILSLDFGSGGNVEPGFTEFTLSNGASQTFGAITVSLATNGNGDSEHLAARDRSAPSSNGAFTQGNLLRDFIFTDGTTPTCLTNGGCEGIDMTISGLDANTSYDFVLWSNEGATLGIHPEFVADWTANGAAIPALTDYTPGGPAPTSDLNDFRTEFSATTNGLGEVLLTGLDAGDFRSAHMINGLQIIPEPTSVTLLGLGLLSLAATARRRLRA